MLSEYSVLINTFVLLYSIIVLSSLYIRGIVFLEWIISFLHYIIPINSAFLVFFLLIFPDLFPSFVFLSVCTIPLLIRFVNFTILKPRAGTGTKQITILFFNKLFSNRNYLEIDEKIKQINPDIIGMAELQDGEIEKIPALKNYPYITIKPSRPNASLGLFSKYDFITENFKELPHAIVSTMEIQGTTYQVIVFHPSPPIYAGSIHSRDNDLKNLHQHLEILDMENIILLGDFNVTPWSPSYIQYLSKLKWLKNVAQGTGIHTTLRKGPFMVFIDFIFVPKKSVVQSFTTEYMQGSDHKLIWAIITV